MTGIKTAQREIPVIRISGKSGSGKTTFILRLLELLPSLKVGVIKHSRHQLTPPDPVKDTGRHLHGGAAFVAGLSDGYSEFFLSEKSSLNIEDVVKNFSHGVDIVFIEGGRDFDCPTILLGDLPEDAIASDIFLKLKARPEFTVELIELVKRSLERFSIKAFTYE